MRVAIVSIWNGPAQDWALAAQENHREYSKRHGYEYRLLENFETGIADASAPLGFKAGWDMPAPIQKIINEGFDYVFWMDQDSLFTNLKISLDDLISKNKSLVFTGDHNDICNGGHLLFKSTKWTKEFLDKWANLSHIRNKELKTTHLSESGQPGTQVALSALVANFSVNSENFTDAFNSVNLFPGNPDRKIKKLAFFFRPTNSRNCRLIMRQLIDVENKEHIFIVPWRRLNSYRGTRAIPYSGRWRKNDPIVHLVAGDKKYWKSFSVVK